MGGVNDLLLISDYLLQAYQGFGEPLQEASRHAAARIEAVISAAERLDNSWLLPIELRISSVQKETAQKP